MWSWGFNIYLNSSNLSKSPVLLKYFNSLYHGNEIFHLELLCEESVLKQNEHIISKTN